MEELTKDSTSFLSGMKSAALGRRLFMRYLGTTAAAGVALSACKNEISSPVPSGSGREGYRVVDLGDLGSNDTGILNYAYALEQLEAAFYTQVIATPYSNMSAEEKAKLSAIRDHEVVHREFFKTALGSAAIPGLTPDFSSINFADRMSVLKSAKLFENIGVSAYNGAGQFIKNADYLTLAGKIVSVEARHAAVIATMLEPESALFAGDEIIYPSTGLEEIRVPSEVLAIVGPMIKETIHAMPVARRA